jgi:hypothetical protein
MIYYDNQSLVFEGVKPQMRGFFICKDLWFHKNNTFLHEKTFDIDISKWYSNKELYKIF